MADTNARLDARQKSESRKSERLGRITFRAWRRGFREADLVLGPFAEQVGPGLDDVDLDAFEALLAQDDDHQLYAWIIGTEPTPDLHETPLMARLRDFMRNHVAHAVAQGAG